MPFGFCRECTYCRSLGQTVQQVVKAGKSPATYRWECLRHAPVRDPSMPTNIYGTSPHLDDVEVDSKFIGCGEFELDPDALLDEYEQQQ